MRIGPAPADLHAYDSELGVYIKAAAKEEHKEHSIGPVRRVAQCGTRASCYVHFEVSE